MGVPFNNYTKEVKEMTRAKWFCVEADTDVGNTMNKQVRNAQLAQYIFILGKNCRISEQSVFLHLYLYSSGWRKVIIQLDSEHEDQGQQGAR